MVRPSRLSVCLGVVLALGGFNSVGAQERVQVPASDRPLAVSMSDVFTMGGAEGTGWEELSTVSELVFDAAGNLYALDVQAKRIVVVDRTGELVRTHEQQGGGPGEFRNPLAIAVTPSGELRVFDVGHMAFIYFDAAGNYVEQKSHDLFDGLPLEGVYSDPEGNLVYQSSSIGNGDEDPEQEGTRPIKRLDPRTGDVVTAFAAWSYPRPEVNMTAGGEGMSFSINEGQVAFGPELHIGGLSDGTLVVSDSTAFVVKLVNKEGRISRTLSRAIEPRATTRGDRERYKEARMARLSERGGSSQVMIVGSSSGGSSGRGSGAMNFSDAAVRDMLEQSLEQTTYAEEMPVIAELMTDWADRIWVARSGPGYGEPGPIDVIEPDGNYMGSVPAGAVELPEAFGPDGLVAYVKLDEFDVPSVVVRQLQPELR